MRDAVGGSFMIKVLLVFLTVYIIFIAVALNYAKAFRVKNKVIDIIEQNEGIRDYTDTSGTIGEINTYLKKASYNVNLTEKNKKDRGVCYDLGYCIDESSEIRDGNITSKYYQVTTFVRIEFPFFNLNITIPIKGETRKVERINN